MNLELFHHFSEKNQRGSVTVQCRIFRQCVHLHHVRRLQQGHDQDDFEGNCLKCVPINDSSIILGSNLNHLLRAQADPQLEKYYNLLRYCPVVGT